MVVSSETMIITVMVMVTARKHFLIPTSRGEGLVWWGILAAPSARAEGL